MWSSLPPGAPTQTPALPDWTRAGSRGFRQPMEQVAPGCCLAYKTRWHDGIKATKYYTRGWTYQESHFAKRSLVFLDERLYSAASAPTPRRNTSPRPQTRYGRSRHAGAYAGDGLGETEGDLSPDRTKLVVGRMVLAAASDVDHPPQVFCCRDTRPGCRRV
jgi:hypothetical protein